MQGTLTPERFGLASCLAEGYEKEFVMHMQNVSHDELESVTGGLAVTTAILIGVGIGLLLGKGCTVSCDTK